MIQTMQFQTLINIGSINRINRIICVLFHHFSFGSVLIFLFDDLFHIAFGYTINL